MKTQRKSIHKVAVFADGENCNIPKFSRDIIDFIKRKWTLHPTLFAYRSWSEINNSKQPKMQNDNWNCIDIGKQCKNCLDNLLIKNCLNFCKDQMPDIDTVVLITCDHDYAPLIKQLKQLNKQVVVIGKRDQTSKKLEKLTNRYYLEDLKSYK